MESFAEFLARRYKNYPAFVKADFPAYAHMSADPYILFPPAKPRHGEPMPPPSTMHDVSTTEFRQRPAEVLELITVRKEPVRVVTHTDAIRPYDASGYVTSHVAVVLPYDTYLQMKKRDEEVRELALKLVKAAQP